LGDQLARDIVLTRRGAAASRVPLSQHEYKPTHLRQERSEQQPQHRKVIGPRLDGAPAYPRHQLGEVGGLRFGLSDNLRRGRGLIGFQLGNLSLTDFAGDGLARPPTA
jgi:hypothetical protein